MLIHAGLGPKPQVSTLQSLVPAGPGPKPKVRPLQSLVPAGSGSQPQRRPVQSLVPVVTSQALDAINASRQEESEEELLEILQAYQATTKRCSAKKPCLSAENTVALPPAKEPGRMLILHQGVATRINNSHQHARGKANSRRGDVSSNDIQKTLRVAHPREAESTLDVKRHRETLRVLHPSGGREQLEQDSNSKPKSIPAYGPIWVQNHMRPRQPILSKPRDGELLLLYLKEQKHTGSAVLVQRANIFLHTPEVQRSLGRQMEKMTSIREPPCFKRVYPKIFGFQENQFHKLRVSRGRSPKTSMLQEDKFQNLWASGGYLLN
ncbi:hypothetical protein F2Q68_00021083 [Brassica cretica]|uniref:Uncharacterized protein n=1 Tax=Brassica cretica TaxID=69181 RepID=A0A8S9FXJ5_BRACR|nr:hypothetical protein F2Q68_00021083 [Brassica cretica]